MVAGAPRDAVHGGCKLEKFFSKRSLMRIMYEIFLLIGAVIAKIAESLIDKKAEQPKERSRFETYGYRCTRLLS